MSKKESKPSTYYKDMIPQLIQRYKKLIETCFNVADEDLDLELSADKRHAELRAKRDAMVDAQHYAKEIDLLENELNGVEEEEQVADHKPKNWAKMNAKRPA